MITTAIFPARYVQGDGALSSLGQELSRLGDSALAICDPYVHRELLPAIQAGIGDDVRLVLEPFGGECSDEEIGRLRGIAEREFLELGMQNFY